MDEMKKNQAIQKLWSNILDPKFDTAIQKVEIEKEAIASLQHLSKGPRVKPGENVTITLTDYSNIVELQNVLTASEMARMAMLNELVELRPKVAKMGTELNQLWDMLALYMAAAFFMARDRSLDQQPPEMRGEVPLRRDQLSQLFDTMNVEVTPQGNHILMTVREKFPRGGVGEGD